MTQCEKVAAIFVDIEEEEGTDAILQLNWKEYCRENNCADTIRTVSPASRQVLRTWTDILTDLGREILFS